MRFMKTIYIDGDEGKEGIDAVLALLARCEPRFDYDVDWDKVKEDDLAEAMAEALDPGDDDAE